MPAKKKKKAAKKTIKAKKPTVNKAHQTKLIKLEMLRYCQLWKFSEELTVSYFKQKGYNLSHTHFFELKTELDSDQTTITWFNDVALKTMEKDHMTDYQSLTELQAVLMQEINQLNLTNAYIKDPKDNDKLLLNPEHDSNTISRLIAEVESIMKTKAEMLAATPHVQAIMVKQREDDAKLAQQEIDILAAKN